MENISNYIGGELVQPIGGGYLNNINPATGLEICKIPDSGAGDVEKAFLSAKQAFPSWSQLPAAARADYLYKIADLIDRDLDMLAEAESIDNGKPLSLAKKVDIPRASANLRFYAGAGLHDHSEFHDMGKTGFNYTLRRPVGVAACISPWNLPLYLFTWKVAPALAAGNTVVAKPSEVTPLTAFLFSKLCIEAGLPPGVLNIVHGTGPGAGNAMVEHPGIPVISFTGGTQTGAHIARTAAPMFKKLSLELGGKNPNLIFADCDLDKAVKTACLAAFTNQGEICLCGSRIYVEKSIYAAFMEKFIPAVEQLKVGAPDAADTRIGAIVSEAHFNKILACIALAKSEGGTCITGGKAVNLPAPHDKGFFIEPTVITGLPPACRTNREEIFGPVVSVGTFESEEEAIALANGTNYGLAAVVFTNNLSRAHRVAAQIDSGIVWVNCWLLRDLRTPFGGMKQSGVGREGGFEALHFFTEAKNVCISY
jgi:aminomuconate-semialdehyde/2-hydroxymuconate-6-semialdehyde dehydrogenase